MSDYKVTISFTITSDSLDDAFNAVEFLYGTGAENVFHRARDEARDIKDINIVVGEKSIHFDRDEHYVEWDEQ